jgi:hypothetical protein
VRAMLWAETTTTHLEETQGGGMELGWGSLRQGSGGRGAAGQAPDHGGWHSVIETGC